MFPHHPCAARIELWRGTAWRSQATPPSAPHIKIAGAAAPPGPQAGRPGPRLGAQREGPGAATPPPGAAKQRGGGPRPWRGPPPYRARGHEPSTNAGRQAGRAAARHARLRSTAQRAAWPCMAQQGAQPATMAPQGLAAASARSTRPVAHLRPRRGLAGRDSPPDGRSGGPGPVCDSARDTERPAAAGALPRCCAGPSMRGHRRAWGGGRGRMWVPVAPHMRGRIGIRHGLNKANARCCALLGVPAASHLRPCFRFASAWLLPPIWGHAPSPPLRVA